MGKSYSLEQLENMALKPKFASFDHYFQPKSWAIPWQNYNQSRPNRIKIILLVKLLCLALLSLGFLFQCSQLLRIYLSGKTVVEIRVQKQKFSGLPALTLCFPTALSMEKISQKHQDTLATYRQYLDHLSSINQWNDLKNETSNQIIFELFSYFESRVKDNLTLRQVYEDLSWDQFPIGQMRIVGTTRNREKVFLTLANLTMVYSIIGRFKCQTIVCVIDNQDELGELDLHKYFVFIRHEDKHFPSYLYNMHQSYASIHQVNIQPQLTFEYFRKIHIGKVNLIRYSEIHTKSLPPPYETGCRDYDHQMTWTDCLASCRLDKLMRACNLSCYHSSFFATLIRKEFFAANLSARVCTDGRVVGAAKCIDDKMVAIDGQCESLCPQPCYEIYYEMDSENMPFQSQTPEFIIEIAHLARADQVIEHRPVMRWIEMVSNFGGLLGMWLGLSGAVIIDSVFKLVFNWAKVN